MGLLMSTRRSWAACEGMSNHHREFVMTKVKTLCASGALLLIGSTLAFAQTITPPTDGSHPDLATQPDYHATVPSTPAAPPASHAAIKTAGPKQIYDDGQYPF